MKILVISHNVFSNSENMGKTLYKLFSNFQEEDICQLYFHSEIPTIKNVCNSYYRITDQDVLKSIFIRTMSGTRFTTNQICSNAETARTDSGTMAKIYQKGRKRTPIIYIMRDCMWSLGKWFSSDLKQWLKENKPDIIFFASGDYSFSYKITNKIAKYLNIPVVVYCVDDFYLQNMKHKRFVEKIRQYFYMKTVKKTIALSSSIITICEKMSKDYSSLFNKNCHVLYTTAEDYNVKFSSNPKMFAYFGSLGLERNKQLIEIGKAVDSIKNITGINTVDVFTADKDAELLKEMAQAKGITVHKSVSESEMLEIQKNCIAVIHTESFDEKIRNRIRYSVSTKIAESLMCGPCLFAYGPKDVASIEYLIQYGAAFVVTDPKDLVQGLQELFTNSELREQIINAARNTAKEKHNSQKNYIILTEELKKAINKATEDSYAKRQH